jgi:hypothetical protein
MRAHARAHTLLSSAKQAGEQRLQTEYQRLVEGLAREGLVTATDEILADPGAYIHKLYLHIPSRHTAR